MKRRFLPPPATKPLWAIHLGFACLCLAAMVGCQGFSTSKSNQTSSGILSLSGSALNFGSVTAGKNKTLSVTLANTGGAAVTVSSVSISSKYFALTGTTLPLSISAGQAANATVEFSPNAAGAFSATVSIASDASDSSETVSLTGTGVASGNLLVSPNSEGFGSVTVGSQSSQTITLTNDTGATVNISQASVSGTGFKLSGITTPLALNASQTATFTVTFAPQAAGSASGSVTIASDAPNSPLSLPLSGTGVTQGALGSNPTSLDFGSVIDGSKQVLSETVTNTGGSTLTISNVATSGTGFSVSGISTPAMLTAGQSATFSVTFAPVTAGSATGSVTITSNGSNPSLSVALSGTGLAAGALGANPTSLSFGTVTDGSNKVLSETVTNTGGSTVTISNVATSGTGFSVSGISTPATLAAGQSATFSVTFAPVAAGSASGSVTITSNATNPTLSVPLSGTGVAAGVLGSNPTSLNFGSVTDGSNQVLSETVTNTGGSTVTISNVASSGTGFSVSGISTPATLTPGQSATFSVTFAPVTPGSASGSVTITSNGSNPSLSVPLSGTGVAVGALGANPTSLSFGNVLDGSNKVLSETVTNTGGTTVTISNVAASGTGFSVSGISTPATLTAGQSATFSVTFAPVTPGSATGSVTITSNAPNPTLSVPLSGTGVAPGALGANPTSLSFGSVPDGSNQVLSETVTNTGGSTLTISNVASSGSGFSVSGISTPVTLTAGQSATFSVTFAPVSPGSVSGSVTVTSTGSNPTLTIPLTGTGTVTVGQLSATATVAVGSVVDGTSGTAAGILTATGANVTVTGASSNSTLFTISGLSLPVTIPAGQSASFTVTFSPLVSGSDSATLTFTSNASPSTTTNSATGTGTPAPTHTVSLSWNASTSSNVSGYNIYRAVYTTSCGSFSKINGTTLDTSTAYTDSAVTDGTNYCYATTAVNSSSEESGYSNIVSDVQIPAP